MHLFKDEVTSILPMGGVHEKYFCSDCRGTADCRQRRSITKPGANTISIKTVKETADYINNNVSQDVSIDELASPYAT